MIQPQRLAEQGSRENGDGLHCRQVVKHTNRNTATASQELLLSEATRVVMQLYRRKCKHLHRQQTSTQSSSAKEATPAHTRGIGRMVAALVQSNAFAQCHPPREGHLSRTREDTGYVSSSVRSHIINILDKEGNLY